MTESKYEEFQLYKGKVIVRFYPLSHMYYVSVDGGKFVRKGGVTGIIGIKDKSRPLQIWQQQITADFLMGCLDAKKVINEDLIVEAIMQCDIQKEEAADIGKEIHAWCEHHIRHKLKQKGYEKVPPVPDFPEALTGVNSFLKWEKENKVKWITTERPVYSKKYDYIGTMDFEAVINGLHCAGDFKSSNSLYNGVRMQIEAYASADEEEIGKKKYDGRWAVRLSKYTEKEYIKREQRKVEIKEAIARVQGKEYKNYGIKPYQVFEAQFLDNEKGSRAYDMEAFLAAKTLKDWDYATDPFTNGGVL